MQNETLNMIGNIKVTLPSSIKYMSNYVLREQNDWFEDEIKFLRQYLKQGMKMIDIGANYGFYTLSCAKVIGDQGKVWAFEPSRDTYDCLVDSISQNSLKNIVARQTGLSDTTGSATLYTAQNSELNSLERTSPQQTEETINLDTLDQCMKEYGWEDIDFIKMDAEGAESRIINAGEQLLNHCSPLIMYELKHGETINKQLINQLNSLGFKTFRLIPSINILVPFDYSMPIDGYQLNLFCCKDDLAEKLKAEDWIISSPTQIQVNKDLAEKYINDTSYAHLVTKTILDDAYHFILCCYIYSLDHILSRNEKAALLLKAMDVIRGIPNLGVLSVVQLCTLARVTYAAGERQASVKILSHILQNLNNEKGDKYEGLFIPAHPEYDHKTVEGHLGQWLLASALQLYIEIHAYSAYFAGQNILGLFDKLESTGYMSNQMKRRQQLANELFS